MNSSWRTAMTEPRTIRAYQGNHEMATASMALNRPAPSAAVIGIVSNSGGKARNTSETRIKAVSMRPPK